MTRGQMAQAILLSPAGCTPEGSAAVVLLMLSGLRVCAGLAGRREPGRHSPPLRPSLTVKGRLWGSGGGAGQRPEPGGAGFPHLKGTWSEQGSDLDPSPSCTSVLLCGPGHFTPGLRETGPFSLKWQNLLLGLLYRPLVFRIRISVMTAGKMSVMTTHRELTACRALSRVFGNNCFIYPETGIQIRHQSRRP